MANPEMLMYDTEKKHSATKRVRIHSPPRLPTELTMGIRDSAAKAFKVGCPPLLLLRASSLYRIHQHCLDWYLGFLSALVGHSRRLFEMST